MSLVFLEIVDYRTGEVRSKTGPMPRHKAGPAEMVEIQNMDQVKFFTRIVTAAAEGLAL
jgi:hypothetical protein